LGRVREIAGADAAAILLADENGALGVRAATDAGPRTGDITTKSLAAGAVRARRPLASQEAEGGQLAVPLFGQGRVIGALHLARRGRRPFAAEEIQLVQLASERLGGAIEQARLLPQERRVSETVQRSMLPERLPEIPGVEVAARYFPAAKAGEVGGDWYEMIALADGRIGVAVGDVAGRGLKAAALMGQLRNVLRAYALESGSPAEVVERLDELVRSVGDARIATLVYLVLDPRDWSARFVSAGHPPPLLVPPDGPGRFLEHGRSAPLGVRANGRAEAEAELGPGSTLVLYTDGLVERRGESIDAGLQRLADAVERCEEGAERVCDSIVDELVDPSAEDDSALLIVRPLPFRERLELRMSADPGALAAMRRALKRWLEGTGATRTEVNDVLVACGEAAANAVEHAYGPGDATFELVATHAERQLEVTIRDEGRWRAPRGENRGRGTALMNALVDSVDLESTPVGTTVVLRRELERKEAMPSTRSPS
jgi:serine phosphatase RsbU (regulator of sigma subunit)/anti-sigma regulatory factor (Ser/Thr protein kinase)